MSSPLALTALNIAQTQIGKKEDPLGSNWGHPVKDYLHTVGIDFPAAWCYAFVYWCFNQVQSNSNPLPKTGSVLTAWNKGEGHQLTHAPQQGDIFIMDFGHGLGHTGIVESIDGAMIHTIEGNTNDTGSREGIEVCRKTRAGAKILGYLRY